MDNFEAASKELISFIKASPSPYHAVAEAKRLLNAAGFTECREYRSWRLTPGGKYYVVRSDSSIIAFKLPIMGISNFQLIASHSDSPTFKIKEEHELLKERHYVSLNVERYGGMLCAPWFDRPLSVAGRIFAKHGNEYKTHLVNIDRDLVMIPSLAIHMDREANTGHKYQFQKELIPLFGDADSQGQFMEEVAETAGVAKSDILSTDLFLYNRSSASIWGAYNEFLSAPRLDDLLCAYASLKAITEADNETSALVCCIFDNEEVGSTTKQGADSSFLSDVLDRICECMGLTLEQRRIAISESFMISADNGHAVHPNYPEKADPTNRNYMNDGILIKYNANQKYTTDAISAGLMKAICDNADIPYQCYANHSDIPGGSTLGNISSSHVSINTIDIGVAQLAMHSPYETCGIRDTFYLLSAMKAFYEANIRRNDNGNYMI